MRVLIALIVIAVAMPVYGASLKQQQASTCPQTSSYLANTPGEYRGAPLQPKKLTELPRAVGYMAVYRTINGCDAPMTMVEYRNTRRR